MPGNNFLSAFELYKTRYLQQDQGVESKKALDIFEKWLKKNTGLICIDKKNNKKVDLFSYISGIVDGAHKILVEKGVKINVISLGLKESSRCITVFNCKSIYYRVGRTNPRKGPYRGMELLVMELVMDGNKNSIFVPLLKRIELLEKSVGKEIQRENENVEATGKYRFKLLFPLGDYSETAIKSLSEMLAKFIYYTRYELISLNII